ncbi:sodium/glutamate symporter [Selenihalanaerobacter shriftii]|uniref:Glutamate:Na+ symporter, ESS family n=1 Tax=Selenihalanaerobacter shriftii TaxID=142842 RepID=A0A1T4PU13_9FIRM|nr:sodium/glutamate symporter [Selenihalanaerobacter shriftii]SJZ94771.1 glutamate:Na+ symporter, ESS family [Selenihalanaerobacter shriftii]
MYAVHLSSLETLAVATALLLLGYYLTKKVRVFKINYIPAPVIGGLLCALTVFGLKSLEIININFDISLKPLFFAGFFASIGFRTTSNMLRNNKTRLLLFLIFTVIVAFAQKIMAIYLAPILELDLIESLAESLAHMDGGMTKKLFVPALAKHGIPAVKAIFKGVVILSLTISSLIGGPLFRYLKRKYNLGQGKKTQAHSLTPPLLLKHITIYIITLILATGLSKILGGKLFPWHGSALIIASVWRNLDEKFEISKLNMYYLNVLGNISLSLCLILVFMNINFSLMQALHFKILILTLFQILLVIGIAVIIFKVLGNNLVAALIAVGLPGFALGLPPATMSTLQSIQEDNGLVPEATFVVPVVGAWWILFINPWVYQVVSKLI